MQTVCIKNFLLLTLSCVLIAVSVEAMPATGEAGHGYIRGQVVNLLDESPLSKVTIYYGGKIYNSDERGWFRIPRQQGSRFMVFEMPGFLSQQVEVQSSENAYRILLQQVWQADTVRVVTGRASRSELDLSSYVTRFSVRNNTPSQSLATLLQGMNNLFLKSYGGEEGVQTISSRGLGAEHTLVTLDGIPLNDPQLGSMNLATLGTEDFSDVEIYRGGNSVLFGSGTSGGVINLRQDITHRFGYRVGLQSGAYGLRSISAKIELPYKKITQLLSVRNTYSPNAYRFLSAGETYRRENSDFHKNSYDYLAQFQPGPANSLTMQLLSYSGKRGAPNAFVSPESYQGRTRITDETLLGRLKWESRMSSSHQLTSQVYARRNWMSYDNPDIVENDVPVSSRHFNEEAGLQVHDRIRLRGKIFLNTGLETSHSRVKSSEVRSAGRNHVAAYLLAEYAFWNHYNSTASLFFAARQEWYSDFGKILLPRIGTTLKWRQVEFFTSIGRNFRAPTFNDLYWTVGGNPDLQPEKSINFEGGANITFPGAKGGRLHLSLYSIRLKNMIRWFPENGNIWRPQNLDRVHSRGIELQADGWLFEHLFEGTVNYKYGLSTITSSAAGGNDPVGKRLPYLPAVQISAQLKVNLSGMSWGADMDYMSYRYSSLSNLPQDILPSATVFNLFGQYQIEAKGTNLMLFGQVNNLSGAEYETIQGYPLPLEEWKLGMSVSFLQK